MSAALLAGLFAFFSVHALGLFAPARREAWRKLLGPLLFKGLYSLVSLAGLILIVRGYEQSAIYPRYLYLPPYGARVATALLMAPVFVLLITAYLPGRYLGRIRHPMLSATVLWAVAHLLSNGTWADVALFGAFGLWGLLLWLRDPAKAPERLAPPPRPSVLYDVIAVAGGAALYAFFYYAAHGWLFGVTPYV